VVRILAFTDPHGEKKALREILVLAESGKPDLIVCSGDVSFFGKECDTFLRDLGVLRRTVYFVPGNHETPSVAKELTTFYPYLKDVSFQLLEVAGVRLTGVPGSDAFWPGANPIAGLFSKAAGVGQSGDRTKPLVLLSHYPPSGTAVSGTSVITPDSGGSRLVWNIVDALHPALVVCGHYHQDFGKEDRMGTSRIVNPGPGGRILEVEPCPT
jgi:Icc-related predicted phosphoesterase